MQFRGQRAMRLVEIGARLKSMPRVRSLLMIYLLVATSHLGSVQGFAPTAVRAGIRAGIFVPGLKSTSISRCTLVSHVAAPFRSRLRHTSRVGLGLNAGATLGGDQGATYANATVTLTSDGWKTKKHMNAYRKIFHAFNGVVLACAYELFMTRRQATIIFGASFIGLTLIEILRLRYAQSAVSMFLFGKFRAIARDYETSQVALSVAPYCSLHLCSACHTSLRQHFYATWVCAWNQVGH